MVIKASPDSTSGGSTNVTLYGFHVWLKGAFDPLTFDYFLRVRREDRARCFRGRAGEGDVGEAAVEAPAGEMTGTRLCSALVALSSGAATGGEDTSQSRCESRPEGIW